MWWLLRSSLVWFSGGRLCPAKVLSRFRRVRSLGLNGGWLLSVWPGRPGRCLWLGWCRIVVYGVVGDLRCGLFGVVRRLIGGISGLTLADPIGQSGIHVGVLQNLIPKLRVGLCQLLEAERLNRGIGKIYRFE